MNPAPPKMHYVYLLKSAKNNWIYIGFTSNLRRRIEEHNLGKDYSTRKYLPIDLVYYEAYRSENDAKNREKCLKQHGNALRLLKRRIKNSLSGGAG